MSAFWSTIVLMFLGGNVSDGAWPASDPTNSGGWIVNNTFTDEFNGSSVDSSKWHKYHTYWGGRPPGLFDPANVTCSGGMLRLKVLDHNYAKNSSFEKGDLTDWILYGTGNASVTSVSSEVHRGQKALKLDGVNGVLLQFVTGLSPNTTYRLAGWGRRGTGASLTMGVQDYGGPVLESPPITATTWPHTSAMAASANIQFTTGASNTSAVIWVKGSGTGTVFADELSVVRVPTSTGKNLSTCYFGTGLIQSKTHAPPGYYEVRMKAANSSHCNSFYFQSGALVQDPVTHYGISGYSEIDVFEIMGNPKVVYSTNGPTKFPMNTHYLAGTSGWGGDEMTPSSYSIAPDVFRDAFHTGGIEWDAATIKWYLDGSQVFSVPIPTHSGWKPFELDQYLFIDTQVFEGVGIPNDDNNTDFQVDYVRGWNKSLVPNAIYEIFPLHAQGLRLNSTGTSNGSNVNVTTDTNANSQRWKAIDLGGGVFELAPQNATGYRLEIPGGWDVDGLNVQIYQSNGHVAQKWKIESAIPAFGVVEVIPQGATTKRMEVENGGTSSGTNMRIKLDTSADHQRWVFTRYSQAGF